MTGFDWLMVFGLIFVAAIMLRGFSKADKVDSIEQPDWPKTGGGPNESD